MQFKAPKFGHCYEAIQDVTVTELVGNLWHHNTKVSGSSQAICANILYDNWVKFF